MAQIKYAIFDVGKTVYPFTLTPLVAYMQHETTEPHLFAKQHSPHFYDYTSYMKGEITDSEFAQELCFFCCVPYNKKRLIEINIALHQGCGKYFPETIKTMNILHHNGTEICLLSNALPLLADTANNLVKTEFAFTSYNLGLLKPDPLIFQTVMDQLNTTPEQILFFDDKKNNVASAKSLGINAIIYQQETVLKDLANYLPQRPTLAHSKEA